MITEADIWRSIIGVLRTGLDQQGFNSVLIKQSFQPIKQGVDTANTVYLFKISSVRYGFQGRNQDYNLTNTNFDITEKYWIEAVYQLTAHIARDIQDSSSLTSYDIADVCSAILQAKVSTDILLTDGIGLQRIQDIRNPISLDDYDRFDQDSNFDFTISYRQTLSYTDNAALTVESDVLVV